jgi:hypothetical protein
VASNILFDPRGFIRADQAVTLDRAMVDRKIGKTENKPC